MILDITRRSVMMTEPPQRLKDALRVFRRHGREKQGEYEDLFTLSEERDSIITMPGFANRIVKMYPRIRVCDRRVPMPAPSIEAATTGLEERWRGVVSRTIENGGGTVTIPTEFGMANMAAAIIRAYSHDDLVSRGTPLCVVIAKNLKSARSMCRQLRKQLPGREVGLCSETLYTDSADVVVTYGAMKDISGRDIGILIADMSIDTMELVRCVSAAMNAARWGVCETSSGRDADIDIVSEGLFGPDHENALK